MRPPPRWWGAGQTLPTPTGFRPARPEVRVSPPLLTEKQVRPQHERCASVSFLTRLLQSLHSGSTPQNSGTAEGPVL